MAGNVSKPSLYIYLHTPSGHISGHHFGTLLYPHKNHALVFLPLRHRQQRGAVEVLAEAVFVDRTNDLALVVFLVAFLALQ